MAMHMKLSDKINSSRFVRSEHEQLVWKGYFVEKQKNLNDSMVDEAILAL